MECPTYTCDAPEASHPITLTHIKPYTLFSIISLIAGAALLQICCCVSLKVHLISSKSERTATIICADVD